MKLCHVMFSTNRVEYLIRSFKSMKNVSYPDDAHVDWIFIDDYPLNRNDDHMKEFAKYLGGFNEVILHDKNMGITSTWQSLFDLVKERDYDYIIHQEDDVELLQPVNVGDMIEIIESDINVSQVQLKRNCWYDSETEDTYHPLLDSDQKYKDYSYDITSPYFWMLFSVYPSYLAHIDYVKETGRLPSESSIAEYCKTRLNKHTAILKNNDGSNIINHFGNYTKGKRCETWEPDWNRFQVYDPTKMYCSKTGKLIS